MAKKSYAEFVKREKAPEEWPALTVEIQTSYEPAFDGSKAQRGELLQEMPRGSCVFDADNRCWRVHPAEAERAVEIAKRHFAHVLWRDGDETHDLVTGKTFVQGSLF